MKQDRSHWTVRKVSFEEAEELDDQYYASLSPVERLMQLMDLRAGIGAEDGKIKKVVRYRNLYEQTTEF